jgi:hypothetical protein
VKRFGLGILLLGAQPLLANPSHFLSPGTYTNEEEVYFEAEAGRTPPPWIGVRVTQDAGKVLISGVNAYGEPVNDGVAADAILASTADTITAKLGKDRKTMLRRARDVTCWGTAPKAQKKTDGSEDWYFVPGLKMHDQGGRVRFGGGTSGAPEVILRMRNVVWASGSNRPSVVLYVHTPAEPERAVSYVWGDPDVGRLGINLRWMQASCTISKGETR